MTSQSVHAIGSSLLALPAAMLFSRQLLLTQKTSVTVTSVSDDGIRETYHARATKLTTLLKSIPGWNHDGLND